MDGVTGEQGIKTTGVPEDYPAIENGKELEYFKFEFCKTRYWKFAEKAIKNPPERVGKARFIPLALWV